MSLPDFSTQSALFSNLALGAPLFPPTDRYRLFAQKIYPLLVQARPHVQKAYCAGNGRAAIEPVWLLGVTLLQYLEGVPDRQAVDLLRYHAGWNFALNRTLGEEVFHPTTLVYFRDRLIEKQLSPLVFGKILEGLVEAGLVACQSKQRLDSTQMLGLVRRMSRVDCVRESLRLALEELETSAEKFGRPDFWPRLWERYVESQLDYKAGADALKGKLEEAGSDAALLLAWVASLSDPKIGAGEKMKLLQRVFAEQFALMDQTAQPRKELPSDRVQNPHEPEAHYAVKGQGAQKKEHIGYKVQVAETVVEQELAKGEPTRNFVTGIVTHPAQESDRAGAAAMASHQSAMGLGKPPVQYVDGAYVSAEALVRTQAEGRQLMGPAARAPHNNGGKFTTEQFVIVVEERKAVCPAGQANTQCGRIQNQQTGEVTYRFEWSNKTCQGCPLREQCLGKGQKHRTVLVSEYHSALQARRAEQKTDAFAQEMKKRNAIEGTQSELVRAHGMRRARYRGLAKARLQNYFAGAACNAKRWIKRIVWEMKAGRATVEPALPTG